MKLWLLLGGGAALIAALWGLIAWTTAPRIALQKTAVHAAEAQAITATAQGSLNTTAAQVVARETIREQPIVQQTKVIEHEIAVAPGSDALVDPRSADAFVGGLCRNRPSDEACGPHGAAGPDVPGDVSPGAGPGA